MWTLTHYAYCMWLFTLSDLKTIFAPSLVFAGINYLALGAYGIEYMQNNSADPSTPTLALFASRLTLAALWIWLHLLAFSVSNQRSPLAIKEDSINKPWRPMPRGLISADGARALTWALYPGSSVVSLALLGGTRQSLGLLVLGVWYNEFGGGDGSPLSRSLINSLGYTCFTSGALEVAYGGPLPLTNAYLASWLLVLGGIIVTTGHVQDMEDQDGDRLKGRRSVPLVIGDAPTRYSIAVAMLFWGFFCPRLWDATHTVTVICQLLASTVAVRTLACRSLQADKRTFQLWNTWICSVYILPLFSANALYTTVSTTY